MTRAFYQYILILMSKKKLGNFHDLINTYFQSFICFPQYAHFLASIFWKNSLALLNRIQPILERLRKTLQSHENIWSLTDLSGANIGIHSNSRDWLFWMFIMPKINPLMNKSLLFWKDVKTVFSIFIKNSRNAIPKYGYIIAPHVSRACIKYINLYQNCTVLCWFDQM